jgi:hypothetical protein
VTTRNAVANVSTRDVNARSFFPRRTSATSSPQSAVQAPAASSDDSKDGCTCNESISCTVALSGAHIPMMRAMMLRRFVSVVSRPPIHQPTATLAPAAVSELMRSPR